ncbi:MAG: preprotein translocase subunit SecG [Geovibrio sp.]|uniref:preprotein translocase subunit SecG n=1 Tax=Geovibrio ferrireducens TaxID=46201 RepID=UPI0022481501|nr:preprotein translocase subunit SecG [Geovibrio ferrireducens]MCD8568434.1 preprotein translocase subunit SecG [Geovibrio sp.]
MYTYLLVFHIFVCMLLIIAVLLQSGKGSELSAALGGGSGSLFGPGAPANIMNKITSVIAITFMITSLGLAVMSKERSSGSITDRIPQPLQQTAPMAPSDAAPQVPMESK